MLLIQRRLKCSDQWLVRHIYKWRQMRSAGIPEDKITGNASDREKFQVRAVCTTDDPCDDLHWRDQIAADQAMQSRMLPAFRPDKAVNIERPGFQAYIEKLAGIVVRELISAEDVAAALVERIDYFAAHGCICADHGLDYCSLNPNANAAVAPIMGCFQNSGGRLRQGSAWWFNDSYTGMRTQLTELANLGILGRFVESEELLGGVFFLCDTGLQVP